MLWKNKLKKQRYISETLLFIDRQNELASVMHQRMQLNTNVAHRKGQVDLAEKEYEELTEKADREKLKLSVRFPPSDLQPDRRNK